MEQGSVNREIEVIDLSLCAYAHAWEFQRRLFDKIVLLKREKKLHGAISTPNYLIYTEHPHVYTLGRQGSDEHLLLDQEELGRRHAEFFRIDRGGDITYHGPGQIVGYPVFDLSNFFEDIHKYLRFLEEAVILTIAHWGLRAERSSGETGVWLNVGHPSARKICAIGVKASHWVTMHGFALNVNTDLSYFNHIIPCGIRNKGVTSLQAELGHEVDMVQVRTLLTENLAGLFHATLK